MRVFPYVASELKYDGEDMFTVKGQRVKYYMGNTEKVKVVLEIDLVEV